MNVNQRVDKDGVLNFIQNVEYIPRTKSFKVTYFTGWQHTFLAKQFCDASLLECEPRVLQWFEVYRDIEAFSLDHWAGWYAKFNKRWMYETDFEKNKVLDIRSRLHLRGSRRH
jgi:hypothetical protein